MKKITLIFLFWLTGIVSIQAESYWTSFEKDCLGYTIFQENDTSVQLDGFTAYIKHFWTTLNVPEYVYCSSFDKTYKVIGIGTRAFMCEEYLETAYISNTVEYIREEAFLACYILETVTLGKSVNTIEANAFTECENLMTLTCLNPEPPSVVSFDDYHYSYTTLYVPEESIDKYKTHPVWGKFRDIQSANEFNNVEDISYENDTYEIARYNLNGIAVDDNYNGPVIIKYATGKAIKSF